MVDANALANAASLPRNRNHAPRFLAGQAVDETQERLEALSGELDDMCRRLGMGDSFQVRLNALRNAPRNASRIVPLGCVFLLL